jgi:hypothetical protein
MRRVMRPPIRPASAMCHAMASQRQSFATAVAHARMFAAVGTASHPVTQAGMADRRRPGTTYRPRLATPIA